MLMDTRPPRGNGAEPWHNEPNRVAWRDPATGLPCLILRGPMGALCGYVRVPRDHALHGKHYQQRGIERRLNAHGGITFSGCLRNRRMKRGHWFGFDCAHWCDFVPGLEELAKKLPRMVGFQQESQVYRTIDFVRRECTSLAAQLAERKGSK